MALRYSPSARETSQERNMAGGRPSKYDPAFCDAVVEFGKEGQSKAEIASNLEVSRQTLENWSGEHPEFLDALQRAHEHSLAWWEKQARTNLATSGYQSGLWKQAMSGRFPNEPYRERAEVAGPGGQPIIPRPDLSHLSSEQLAALAAIPG